MDLGKELLPHMFLNTERSCLGAAAMQTNGSVCRLMSGKSHERLLTSMLKTGMGNTHWSTAQMLPGTVWCDSSHLGDFTVH